MTWLLSPVARCLTYRLQDWTRYAAQVAIGQSGTYDVGIANTLVDKYFINYDAFALQSIPEPVASAVLFLIGIFVARSKRANDG